MRDVSGGADAPNHPLAVEPVQRLAHRRTAHPVFSRQIELADHDRRRELALSDRGTQTFVRLPAEIFKRWGVPLAPRLGQITYVRFTFIERDRV